MPYYRVTYSLANGREIRQRLQATSADSLRADLRQRGFYPLDIEEVATGGRERRLRFPPKVLARLLRQLEMQLRAGVDEIAAVASLKDTHSDPDVRFFLATIHGSLKTAKATFSNSLCAFPRVLPSHLRAMIAAGDAAGPEATADRLADVREWLLFTERLRKTIYRATRYPAFLCLLVVVFIGFFVGWFVPRFQLLLDAFNTDLPRYTQLIIKTAAWFQHAWPYIAGAAVAAWLGFLFARRNETTAAAIDRVLLRVPFYSHIYRAFVTATITKNMRSILKSEANAIRAIELCEPMLTNRAARAELRQIQRELQTQGATLGTALQRCGYFPPEAVQIIATGEATGHLDTALHDVSTEYETIAREAIDDALTFVEPAIVIAAAVVVGATLLGLILPISHLYESI